jgi:hypothetical protein
VDARVNDVRLIGVERKGTTVVVGMKAVVTTTPLSNSHNTSNASKRQSEPPSTKLTATLRRGRRLLSIFLMIWIFVD